MRKISLYRFITTFCIVPTTDWAAFVQRVIFRILTAHAILMLFSLLKQPLFIMSLIGLLIWAPDTIMWIFVQIGNLELQIMAMMLAKIMPEVFSAGGQALGSWSEIWDAGLSVLPTEMLQVINGLGVGQILGILTTTWSAVSSIKIYRKIMLRAGLL